MSGLLILTKSLLLFNGRSGGLFSCGSRAGLGLQNADVAGSTLVLRVKSQHLLEVCQRGSLVAFLEIINPQIAVSFYQPFAELCRVGTFCFRQLNVLVVVRLGQSLLGFGV